MRNPEKPCGTPPQYGKKNSKGKKISERGRQKRCNHYFNKTGETAQALQNIKEYHFNIIRNLFSDTGVPAPESGKIC